MGSLKTTKLINERKKNEWTTAFYKFTNKLRKEKIKVKRKVKVIK